MATAHQATISRAVAEDGFAIVPGVVSSSQRAELLGAFETGHLHRSKAGIRHALAHPAVAALACNAALLAIARECLGDGVFPFRATLFAKSPQSNWLVVWHQDTALPLKERIEMEGWGPWSMKEGIIYAHAPASSLEKVLALRVHLDDSNAQNGPLRVLPGTHVRGVLSDDEIHQLAEQNTPVDCLVACGGVLAMKPLLVHSSSKSRTESSRRVLHIEYSHFAEFEGGLELAIA